MGLVHCRGCNRLVSDFLQDCPHCRQPMTLEASGWWQFCEQWLLVGKVLLGISLLGLFVTFVVDSIVLADLFSRLTLLMMGLLVIGKGWQLVLFRRRR